MVTPRYECFAADLQSKWIWLSGESIWNVNVIWRHILIFAQMILDDDEIYQAKPT